MVKSVSKTQDPLILYENPVQRKRKILKSTCPSDNHHREFGCPRPKSARPKRFVQTVFRNKINSTCGFWCILIYSNVNCELFTRVQMLLKIKKPEHFRLYYK